MRIAPNSYGDKVSIAIGHSIEPIIVGDLTANPLDNWVAVRSPSDNWFYGMTYGNGNFVTVGAFGAILTSPDGVVWTSQNSKYTNHLYGAGFGDNTFVAVGAVGTILTSWDNGVTWTLRETPKGSLGFQDFCGVAYGNGEFVVVGADGKIITSSVDGATWVDPFWTIPVPPTENWLFGATYGNGIFVAVGAYGTILTSSDAISWYPEISGTSLHLMSVAYGNGIFVAWGIGNDPELTQRGELVSTDLRDNRLAKEYCVCKWLFCDCRRCRNHSHFT